VHLFTCPEEKWAVDFINDEMLLLSYQLNQAVHQRVYNVVHLMKQNNQLSKATGIPVQ
jgi:hypothetical protein